MSLQSFRSEDLVLSEPAPGATLVPVAGPEIDTAPARSRRSRNHRGLTTVEYAVGSVAAAGLGGVLISVLTNPAIGELLLKLIKFLIEHFMQSL